LAQGAPIRMAGALNHLDELVQSGPEDLPVVIFLQEMVSTDLKQIQAATWVQSRFHITDIDNGQWQSPLYGTTTLIDKRLTVKDVFRVNYVTKFERDGLFVDILMKHTGGLGEVLLRLCNTHLESLVADPPLRPGQLAMAAQQLHESDVHGGVLAGDLNAIQPFDRTLHSENDLKDAYLETGGEEDSEEGYTWGQQVYQELRDKFGCSRMDKILYCGGVEVTKPDLIGVGVKVEESKRAKMMSFGALSYVTDHYGLMADVVLRN